MKKLAVTSSIITMLAATLLSGSAMAQSSTKKVCLLNADGSGIVPVSLDRNLAVLMVVFAPKIYGKITDEKCGDRLDEDCDGTNDEDCDDTPGAAICGNGKVEAGEECDDGNRFNWDGCSNN